MATPQTVADHVEAAKRARAREQIGRIDYLREMRTLALAVDAQEVTEDELAALFRTTRVPVVDALKEGRQTAAPPPGFSGASPYEIAQRYAVGELTREQVVDELSRWAYPPVVRTEGEWDDLLISPPGSWDDVSDALDEGLIDGAIYTEVLTRRHGELPTTYERPDLGAGVKAEVARILAIMDGAPDENA